MEKKKWVEQEAIEQEKVVIDIEFLWDKRKKVSYLKWVINFMLDFVLNIDLRVEIWLMY